MQAEGEIAAIKHELVFAVNLYWLSQDLRKTVEVSGSEERGDGTCRTDADTFGIIKPSLSAETKRFSLLKFPFNMCHQSNRPQITCFQSGSLTAYLKNKGSGMFPVECTCGYRI